MGKTISAMMGLVAATMAGDKPLRYEPMFLVPPDNHGLKLEPLFFLRPSYWSKRKTPIQLDTIDREETGTEDYVERVPVELLGKEAIRYLRTGGGDFQYAQCLWGAL